MKKFKESLTSLSLEELHELKKTLELQYEKAKRDHKAADLAENLKEKLVCVKNRITALRIRS